MNKTEKQKRYEQLKANPVNEFTCQCEGCSAPTMGIEDFKKHLLEVHKSELKGFKGTKRMTMHMDGDDWFSTQYYWEFPNGIKFYQFMQMAREKPNSFI